MILIIGPEPHYCVHLSVYQNSGQQIERKEGGKTEFGPTRIVRLQNRERTDVEFSQPPSPKSKTSERGGQRDELTTHNTLCITQCISWILKS